MNRTVRWIGVGVVFVLCLGATAAQAQQQPVAAEPQAPGRTVQVPPELVPTLPVPRLVKFAGTFKDEQGQPRTGVVGVTFAIYKEQEGGAPLWLETQNVELDEQGHYSVLLGGTKSEGLPLELFSSGETRWLGVQVNLPKELEQPRVLLVSVPYALKAADAETLGGKPFSAFVLAAPPSEGGAGASKAPNAAATTAVAAATIGGGGTQNVVAKFDATGVNVINASISDNGSRINAGEGIDFSSDFSFAGNANPAATGRVQMFDRAFVGFVVRGLNVLFETLQGNPAVPTEVMRVTQAGNVGLGTTAPSQKLEVAGNLKISGGGNALVFPDGSVMSSAATGVGGGTITGVTAGAGLSGGGTAGGVTLGIDATVVPQLGATSNTFTGSITASSFTGSGAGLTNVNAAALNGLASTAFTQLAGNNTFSGNNTFTGSFAAGPASFSGSNSTQIFSTTQSNAAGAAAVLNHTANGTLLSGQSNGVERFNLASNGTLTLQPLGTATAGGGFSSGAVSLAASSFNSGIGLAVPQTFQWQAQPVGNNTANASGQLSLLYGSGTNVPTATGLSLASNGMVTAPSFAGSGASLTNVNAATLGGMASSAFATVGSNTFTGNQSVTGNLSASGQLISTVATGTAPLSVSSSTVVPNLNSSFVGGLAATQLARVDVGNGFTGNQNITGNVSLSGILSLPNTTTGGASGVIALGGAPFVHNFGNTNTFVGASAGNTSASLTGGFNTGVGSSALSADTTGFDNAAFGAFALTSNTTGFRNAAFGSAALTSNTGNNNAAFGFEALELNTTGGANSAFGAFALASNTTATNNSAFGFEALLTNTTGFNNAAFGTFALKVNTGNNNAAFGSSALQNNTTASNNAAFGSGALLTNTTGFNNAAFGFNALAANNPNPIVPGTGVNNSAFGSGGLAANTTGSNNSAFGTSALTVNTTGGGNSAFGGFALVANTMGGFNAAFGEGALEFNDTGNNNSAFGLDALVNLRGASSSNIGIGANAGLSLLTGSNNIYIGSNSAGGTESNSIHIGNPTVQTAATFIAGISGTTSASGVAVLVNSNGQLGTTTSSRRFKHEIADLGGESDLLMKLRPVAFYYKPELDDKQTRQYGLVAEEVAQVAPQLVVFDEDGAPQTVRYHFVNAMLLNEVQKQRRLVEEHQRENEEQRTTITRQESKIQDLAARLAKLEALLAVGPQGPATKQ